MHDIGASGYGVPQNGFYIGVNRQEANSLGLGGFDRSKHTRCGGK